TGRRRLRPDEVTRILHCRNLPEVDEEHRSANVEAMSLRRIVTAFFLMSAAAGTAAAQITPAAGYTPPDDTPSIRVGITLFPLYTYQTTPEATDADGNTIHRSSFDVARAYINLTGQISHLVSFRITPDITRQSALLTLPAGATVSQDSL